MDAAISLDNLTVSYRRHPALHHVNGSFARGSLTAIVGPNGAGKSTLLKSMLGLVPCNDGRVHTHVDARRIAYLPQQAEIDRSFPITVLDCVLLGYWQAKGNWGGIDAAMRARAIQALAAVGLDGFAGRAVSSLSVGQFQRVLFARILLQDAEVILLDEPFNAIDARTTGDLLRIISAWHAERRTVIAVLHDHDQVRRSFPQTLLLARNVVAWGETAEVMCEDNLQRARAMAEAVDEHAGVCAVSESEVLALSGALRPAHEHAHGQHSHSAAAAKGGLP
ncbi:metal ABC transporter ATP-binding protein [Herbaspirillum sp. AP02]|uniref:metal ABC transporter ATP-binding protein n=1 Tax=unclassified Herbaspirillum TaxID=2624150 RepID=UPI0015D964C8|nr:MULTISPECIES: metal ABC transporter ATP-binding protein [unclassified Herbaspirillum]MBG7620484.1 metal ABC transporter ATP-binding protein [Herbaspirillum sp. AP02]NZD67948.1 metal ABC transporter ATP-binding protein [Herbaspirillum sp. AP21]